MPSIGHDGPYPVAMKRARVTIPNHNMTTSAKAHADSKTFGHSSAPSALRSARISCSSIRSPCGGLNHAKGVKSMGLEPRTEGEEIFCKKFTSGHGSARSRRRIQLWTRGQRYIAWMDNWAKFSATNASLTLQSERSLRWLSQDVTHLDTRTR